MTENLRLWKALGTTDPGQTKQFKRSGGFSGTAIKPIWATMRMTEEFGPCGSGWGMGRPEFQVVPGDNKEVLVYCTVCMWHGSEDRIVYGVGGDKVVSYVKANEQYKRPERWENDDEAFKKAYTDALSNAMKQIGVGADVHMGLFDDSKYVEKARKAETTKARNERFDAVKTALLESDDPAATWHDFKEEIEEFKAQDQQYYDDLKQAGAKRKAELLEKERLVAGYGQGFTEVNQPKGE